MGRDWQLPGVYLKCTDGAKGSQATLSIVDSCLTCCLLNHWKCPRFCSPGPSAFRIRYVAPSKNPPCIPPCFEPRPASIRIPTSSLWLNSHTLLASSPSPTTYSFQSHHCNPILTTIVTMGGCPNYCLTLEKIRVSYTTVHAAFKQGWTCEECGRAPFGRMKGRRFECIDCERVICYGCGVGRCRRDWQ